MIDVRDSICEKGIEKWILIVVYKYKLQSDKMKVQTASYYVLSRYNSNFFWGIKPLVPNFTFYFIFQYVSKTTE